MSAGQRKVWPTTRVSDEVDRVIHDGNDGPYMSELPLISITRSDRRCTARAVSFLTPLHNHQRPATVMHRGSQRINKQIHLKANTLSFTRYDRGI